MKIYNIRVKVYNNLTYKLISSQLKIYKLGPQRFYIWLLELPTYSQGGESPRTQEKLKQVFLILYFN
jgi:hypothetical protein